MKTPYFGLLFLFVCHLAAAEEAGRPLPIRDVGLASGYNLANVKGMEYSLGFEDEITALTSAAKTPVVTKRRMNYEFSVVSATSVTNNGLSTILEVVGMASVTLSTNPAGDPENMSVKQTFRISTDDHGYVRRIESDNAQTNAPTRGLKELAESLPNIFVSYVHIPLPRSSSGFYWEADASSASQSTDESRRGDKWFWCAVSHDNGEVGLCGERISVMSIPSGTRIPPRLVAVLKNRVILSFDGKERVIRGGQMESCTYGPDLITRTKGEIRAGKPRSAEK